MSKLPFTVGMELEFTSANMPQLRSANYKGTPFNPNGQPWSLKTDASCGYEVVSPVLRTDDDLQLALNMVDFLNTRNAVVDKKCGFHLHIGGMWADSPNLSQLLKFLARYESAFFTLADRTRQTNRYCAPLSPHILKGMREGKWVQAWFENHELAENKNNRYHWLNCCSMSKYGTIEFRLQGGTLNKSVIKGWVDFILHVCDSIYNAPVSNYRTKVYKTKSHSAAMALHDVLQRTGCYGKNLNAKNEEAKLRALNARSWAFDRYTNKYCSNHREQMRREIKVLPPVEECA